MLNRIFVIGGSAGAHQVIEFILKYISSDIKAAFVIVLHSAANSVGTYAEISGLKSKILCKSAEHGEEIKSGIAYFSVPDHHLFINDDRTLALGKGPRENLFRPSIDVLFRSAATSLGNEIVGILLTGRLSDGTSGLQAIKECGGITVVQNPEKAEYQEMPLIAKKNVDPHYVADIERIPDVIGEIVEEPLPIQVKIPERLLLENSIARKIASQIDTQNLLGEQVALSCPSCGGPLWKMKDDKNTRYRCHVGHAFTAEALDQSQQEALEETLWVSLRTFEEKAILKQMMLDKYKTDGFDHLANSMQKSVDEIKVHIKRLREIMKLEDQ
ncbi:chemotaxis protein CheB [Chondrinema litorale]|uniref:chemotaxis protein CheB n=1 Tax=Chondrinema litorale TaxID=2994555 RepID=UPI0025437F40|nr:chemotaxis protein CheB [Chondrinema litorale]UZR97612.1 chemotaxis protein CheB [Chondrinema litorale]